MPCPQAGQASPACERRVRHVDPLGAAVGVGAVAPVTRGGRRCGPRRWPASGSAVHRQPTRVRSRLPSTARSPRAGRRPCPRRRRRSSPCAPRRATGAAGESRCSCLPPGRSRSAYDSKTARISAASFASSACSTRRRTSSRRVVVHFDDLRRVAHPANRPNEVHRPPPGGRLDLQLIAGDHAGALMGASGPHIGKNNLGERSSRRPHRPPVGDACRFGSGCRPRAGPGVDERPVAGRRRPRPTATREAALARAACGRARTPGHRT